VRAGPPAAPDLSERPPATALLAALEALAWRPIVTQGAVADITFTSPPYSQSLRFYQSLEIFYGFAHPYVPSDRG